MPQLYPKILPKPYPINNLLSSFLQITCLNLLHPKKYQTQQIIETTYISIFSSPIILSTPSIETKSLNRNLLYITATTNDSTNYQLKSVTWKDELELMIKESKSTMETMI